MTPELKTRIETNNIYICELHFKLECILTGTYIMWKRTHILRLFIFDVCHFINILSVCFNHYSAY